MTLQWETRLTNLPRLLPHLPRILKHIITPRRYPNIINTLPRPRRSNIPISLHNKLQVPTHNLNRLRRAHLIQTNILLPRVATRHRQLSDFPALPGMLNDKRRCGICPKMQTLPSQRRSAINSSKTHKGTCFSGLRLQEIHCYQ